MHLLRSSSNNASIICLVRAATPSAAYARITKSLLARGKPALPSSCSSSTIADQYLPQPRETSDQFTKPIITVHPANFTSANLGLSPDVYGYLLRNITHTIHAAWPVNFTLPLRSFRASISALQNLLSLTLYSRRRARFSFCSSTASVLGSSTIQTVIPESVSELAEEIPTLGYSASKWVGEAICARAAQYECLRDGIIANPINFRGTKCKRLVEKVGNRIQILRIGQLCGDLDLGIWNMTEAYPLLLSTAFAFHVLPDLAQEGVGWLAMDTAARAVIEISLQQDSQDSSDGCQVFHVLNPSTTPDFPDLLSWASELQPGLEITSPRVWLQKLETMDGEHPAKKLIGLWRNIYCNGGAEASEQNNKRVMFAMEKTSQASPSMRDILPVSKQHFSKMWQWIEQESGEWKSK